MWFRELAESNNPQRKELYQFLENIESFFRFVLTENNAGVLNFLWEENPDLRKDALETFEGDVLKSIASLRHALEKIPDEQLIAHGLIGTAARFKFRVLNTVAMSGWRWIEGFRNVAFRARRSIWIREWLKRVFEAIDAFLDSLIEAAHAGGLIKEFKDALSALASVHGKPR